jgi:hypothetical protein
MRLVGITAAALSLATLFPACRQRPYPDVTVRDSAQVRIVEGTLRLSVASQWGVGPDVCPAIYETADDPDPLLEDVAAAVHVADLTAILDRRTRQLVIYSCDGTLRRVSGGAGNGPGEFRSVQDLHPYRGDSLVIHDPVLGRISMFDSFGLFGRSIPTQIAATQLRLVGTLDDGALVLTAWRFSERPGITRDTLLVLRLAADGASTDTIGHFPGDEYYLRTVGGRLVWGPRPFGRVTRVAAAGDRIAVGTGDEAGIRYFNSAGEYVMSVRTRSAAEPVNRRARTLFTERRLRRMPGPDARAYASQLYSSGVVPFARELPPYDSLLFDTSGRVWARLPRVDPAEPERWRLHEADGQLAAQVVGPAGASIVYVGGAVALALDKDVNDLDRLRAYSVVPAAGN